MLNKLIETLHPLERKVLPFLKESSSFEEIVNLSKLQEVEVMRALQWLENKNIIHCAFLNKLTTYYKET